MRSIKGEFLSKRIILGGASLRRVVMPFPELYPLERPHQGRGKQRLFPAPLLGYAIQVASSSRSASVDRSSSMTGGMNVLT
ncbi:MAG TPA: hypothetical protein VLJ11_08345 [Bryobacteraceae bacterium]|nr:hypothetical protein [Bryobacteraceae bacterium]